MLRRLSWIAVLVACGSSSSAGDAGLPDASTDVHGGHCVADSPCFRSWACVDETHWIAQETQSCDVLCHTSDCTGATCGSVGGPQACPTNTACIDPQETAPDYGGPPCALAGVVGCAPNDEASFVPKPIVPPTKTPGACTDVDLQQLWARCFASSTATEAGCTSWTNEHTGCVTCLDQLYAGAPFQTYIGGPPALPNVGGCYATFDGTTAPGSCAALEDASLQCVVASCSVFCVQTESALEACVATARSSTCAAFPRCDDEASASYATCSAASPADFFATFGKALCGGA